MKILAAIRREERKLEKQLGRLQHQLNRIRAASGCKSFGRFDQPGTEGRKEAGDVCRCESEDFKGDESAVGKV
jgi:hypothetical protein